MAAVQWKKTPYEDKPFKYKFGNVIPDGDTISTFSFTNDTGVTDADGQKVDSDLSIQVNWSGGTAGTRYWTSCRIVTAAGHKFERHVPIDVVERYET